MQTYLPVVLAVLSENYIIIILHDFRIVRYLFQPMECPEMGLADCLFAWVGKQVHICDMHI